MKNYSKNGGTLFETIPCYPDMGSVTTMDKKQIYKILNYAAMGDGGVYADDNGNYRFVMNMLEEHKDYVDWIHSAISELTTASIKKRNLDNTDGFNRKPQLRLESKSHPYFAKVRNHIYVGKYKGLSSHYLKMLDAEALAILYMCDGCLHIEKPTPTRRLINNSYNVTLNLKRLSEGDTLMLKKALKTKLGLEFNIGRQNQYYYLRLRTKDVQKFMSLIAPFMKPSFNYKMI